MTVWIVTTYEIHAHGETMIDSVWSTEALAQERVAEVGPILSSMQRVDYEERDVGHDGDHGPVEPVEPVELARSAESMKRDSTDTEDKT